MNAHIFWPPLAVLAMFVVIVAFLVVKYGDKLFNARSVPLPQNFEIEDRSSENTVFVEERLSMDDYAMDIIPRQEKYEYSV